MVILAKLLGYMKGGFGVFSKNVQEVVSPDEIDLSAFQCFGAGLIRLPWNYGVQAQDFARLSNSQDYSLPFA